MISTNLRTLLIFTTALLLIGLLYLHRSGDSAFTDTQKRSTEDDREGEVVDWKEVDLTKVALPSLDLVKKVQVEQQTRTVGVQERLYVQTAKPPPGVKPTWRTVLLLHGAAFTSETWVSNIPTMATLAAAGHRVIAIDLPGYGKSGRWTGGDRGAFLGAVIDTLSPDVAPVLVSPSMSGGWAVPLLADAPEKLAGWVPVAPVDTSQGRAFFPSLTLPTMVVYGERDTGLGAGSAKDLALIPTSTRPQVLPGAKHPAYLDQPDLWHKLLLNFLTLV